MKVFYSIFKKQNTRKNLTTLLKINIYVCLLYIEYTINNYYGYTKRFLVLVKAINHSDY